MTGWIYIPLIGEPVAIRNDAGDDIPRILIPMFQGPPRKNKLKTYLTILNFVSTAAPDDKVKIVTRLPKKLTVDEMTTNLNAFLPILTMSPGTLGPTQQWQILASSMVPGEDDLLEMTIGLFNAPLAPVQLILCIDHSHSIGN